MFLVSLFPHSVRVIYFHGRVRYTILVFMRCCTDIFVLQEQWGLREADRVQGNQLRNRSKVRIVTFLLILSSMLSLIFFVLCVCVCFVAWQIMSIDAFHVLLFKIILCTQNWVPGTLNLGMNIPSLLFLVYLHPKLLVPKFWRNLESQQLKKAHE